jgi:hypothetical protein
VSAHRNASRSHPCPVCKRQDQCSWPVENPDRVACYRVESEREHRTSDGRTFWSHDVSTGERKPWRLLDSVTENEVELAPTEIRSNRYVAALRSLTLTAQHSAALGDRGLTGERIEANGYRTYRGQYLPITGLHLERVPGMIVDAQGNVTLRCQHPALLIPVRNPKGEIVALQSRPDECGDGGKYRAVSTFRNGGPRYPSALHWPKGSADVAFRTGEARLTEGRLKADVAFALDGVPTVGLASAGSGHSEAIAELLAIGVRTVVVALDMDRVDNVTIGRAHDQLVEALLEACLTVKVASW